MPTVMIQRGDPYGHRLPGDGQYLKSFDFEAHDGRGEITMTPNIGEAMKFSTFVEAWEFWHTVPKCKPLRDDGEPNRPLTAANWEFKTFEEEPLI